MAVFNVLRPMESGPSNLEKWPALKISQRWAMVAIRDDFLKIQRTTWPYLGMTPQRQLLLEVWGQVRDIVAGQVRKHIVEQASEQCH